MYTSILKHSSKKDKLEAITVHVPTRTKTEVRPQSDDESVSDSDDDNDFSDLVYAAWQSDLDEEVAMIIDKETTNSRVTVPTRSGRQATCFAHL